MNTTLGNGKAVHAAYQGDVQNPQCGGNRASVRYRVTDAEVTCKRCLKMVAGSETEVETVTETVVYIDMVTPTQGLVLVQGTSVYGNVLHTAKREGRPGSGWMAENEWGEPVGSGLAGARAAATHLARVMGVDGPLRFEICHEYR